MAQDIRVGSRVVGKVQDGVFIKRVKASQHFLYRPPAIAFDVSSLKQAEKAGARSVTVIDSESDKVYRALMSTIWDRGFRLNRGFGDQIALVLADWTLGDDPLAEQMKLMI